MPAGLAGGVLRGKVEVRSQRTVETTMGGLGEINVDDMKNNFVNNSQAGQLANIPYRALRSDRNDPRWMTARLKHYVGLKRGTVL